MELTTYSMQSLRASNTFSGVLPSIPVGKLCGSSVARIRHLLVVLPLSSIDRKLKNFNTVHLSIVEFLLKNVYVYILRGFQCFLVWQAGSLFKTAAVILRMCSL